MFSALSPPAGVGARQFLPLQVHRPLMRNSIVSPAGCSETVRHCRSDIIELDGHIPHGRVAVAYRCEEVELQGVLSLCEWSEVQDAAI